MGNLLESDGLLPSRYTTNTVEKMRLHNHAIDEDGVRAWTQLFTASERGI